MKLKYFIQMEVLREAVVQKIYRKQKAVYQVSKLSFQIVNWGWFIFPLDNSHDICPITFKM